ncbi:MAG: A/G-specific adenine glycosylase [Acidobacteriia bacterium]|nr:A/G-specific adenine glycosylase [Terriglobia bacterium]
MDRRRVSLRAARSALLRWYRANRRDLPWRRTRDPYAIWVSEAMLQQTQVSTVVPYYGRFLAAFPGVAELADAPEEAILAAWSGLGYYRRALALKAGAQAVVARHGGRVPSDPADLLALPGIGPYTAGAIASIAFGRPEPALDGNVRRVLSRLLARRGRGATDERELLRTARELVRGRDPGDLNQSLMELGALVCTPRAPGCGACPVNRSCRGRASGHPERYPAPRRVPRAVPVRVAVALVRRRGKILLARRDGVTPFRGEWDLPAAEVQDGADPAGLLRTLLGRLGIAARIGDEMARARHTILNRALRIEVFAGRVHGGAAPVAGESRWVRPEDLGAVAISGATRKILEAAAPAPDSQNRSHGGTQPRSRPSRRSAAGSGSSGRSKR